MKKTYNTKRNTKKGLERIPFVQKRRIVQQLCRAYLKIHILDKKFNFKKQSESIKILSTFDILLEMMNPDYALVIRKDYLEKNKSSWAEEFWSKTTYYKYAHKAVDELLGLIYE